MAAAVVAADSRCLSPLLVCLGATEGATDGKMWREGGNASPESMVAGGTVEDPYFTEPRLVWPLEISREGGVLDSYNYERQKLRLKALDVKTND